ncbi:transcriptional regulator [Lysinibacillus sp. NPDC048646]|uniref:transcriptional regulator n=1 Tax=Lysinibacillus sp. NPDC048646 TaxID=3390574 RepID=UPI003CFF2621
MADYRKGYEFYRQMSEKHGLEPINFHYFILNLSQEQLDAYNDEHAKATGVEIEYEVF